MIGPGEIIDFDMLVTYPRREYVRLPCRGPLPESLEDWISYTLASAVALAEERLKERYGGTRRFVNLQIKHGLMNIGNFHIELGDNGGWAIKRWNSPEGNHLYLLMLEWKYFEHGKIAQYYDRLDHIPEPSDRATSIFTDEIEGIPETNEVANDYVLKLPDYTDPTKETLTRIDKERLKTPIAHTR